MIPAIPRSIVLNICAHGHGDLVCGRPPGHRGHRADACWPAIWDDIPDAAVTPAPHCLAPVAGASPPPIPADGSVNPVPP